MPVSSSPSRPFVIEAVLNRFLLSSNCSTADQPAEGARNERRRREAPPRRHVVQDHHRTGIFEGGTVQSGDDGRDTGVSADRGQRRGEASAPAGADIRSLFQPGLYGRKVGVPRVLQKTYCGSVA